ncbi:hypothetical protein QVD17_24611 [Tagetes erecta]|uniref:Uncharacterized protein n=1 Tax=Tagetes erecta TaxID=13708 RepID=A0AAD8NUW5_TARER|nr:hypothetical protein QVD17_24611 [Tagetes erecta]
MGWFVREGRSELSWVDQTFGSVSAPPMQLLAFLGLVILLMYMSTNSELKEHVEREKMGLKLLLYLLPLVLFLITYVIMRNRLSYTVQTTESAKQDGCSPWGVALIVILVLVLVKYHS